MSVGCVVNRSVKLTSVADLIMLMISDKYQCSFTRESCPVSITRCPKDDDRIVIRLVKQVKENKKMK